jgi:hypothetical protein
MAGNMRAFAHRNRRSWRSCCCAATAWFAFGAAAEEPLQPGALPTFAELEAAGAVVGNIDIVTDDIFDENDPRENNLFYRIGNALHIVTRPSVVRRFLLFESGDPISVRLIEETERILYARDYINDVKIRPVAVRGNVVDIEVRTRDNWTLQPGGSYSREGGDNSEGLSVSEQNLFGTGIALGVSKVSEAARSGTEVEFTHDNALGGWTYISLLHGNYDDGYRDEVSVERPFYALDTRWAAGVEVSRYERVDSLFSGGNIVGQYDHAQDAVEAYGGWSQGLVDGWASRYSIGVSHIYNDYGFNPALLHPLAPPRDEQLTGPFVRWELVEDDFQKLTNRERIQRPEYFAMGFHSELQVGRALAEMGSTRNPWTFELGITDGFRPFGRHDLMTELAVSGQYEDGKGEREEVSAEVRYYLPQTARALFFFGAAGAYTPSDNPEDQLLLGGSNGVRGYPSRYQIGNRRLVFSIEERVYTDWYPFRLFRIGGAVYVDVGRAWGGSSTPAPEPGWLTNIGFGLRVMSDRSSYGKIYHIDLAFPVGNKDPNVDDMQFIVKSRVEF